MCSDPMNILVIGGKLQGTEVVYLAKKAGWTVHLVDKNPSVPAIDLCDYYYKLNLFDTDKILRIFKKVDVVIPALEDRSSIAMIKGYGIMTNTLVLFDSDAFHISSSKLKSNLFFKRLNIPMPRDFEECLQKNLPVLVKPSDKSGSEGVQIFNNPTSAKSFMAEHPDYICQEYLQGPSYSIEVIGNGKSFQSLIITEIIVDEECDCQRVIAPAKINKQLEKEFHHIATTIAEALQIKGIFDIEVIEKDNALYVLEIDARMPSQTPIAVYFATGINMVKEMVLYNTIENYKIHSSLSKYCIVQHVYLEKAKLKGKGEGIMSQVGPLLHKIEYFGADEAFISNPKIYHGFVAELIVSSPTYDDALHQLEQSIKKIEKNLMEEENDTIKGCRYTNYSKTI